MTCDHVRSIGTEATKGTTGLLESESLIVFVIQHLDVVLVWLSVRTMLVYWFVDLN